MLAEECWHLEETTGTNNYRTIWPVHDETTIQKYREALRYLQHTVCLSVSTKPLAVTQRQNVQHAWTCAWSMCTRVIHSMLVNQNVRICSWSCQRYVTRARCASWDSSKTWQNNRMEERKIIRRSAETCLTENKTFKDTSLPSLQTANL